MYLSKTYKKSSVYCFYLSFYVHFEKLHRKRIILLIVSERGFTSMQRKKVMLQNFACFRFKYKRLWVTYLAFLAKIRSHVRTCVYYGIFYRSFPVCTYQNHITKI